ncbi:MAG: putative acetyltransferase [Herbinix sp.]|jgi:acetyltransferase-like isoleucine patch superfamily enzyme|nr:putative acetyltransferase [Herbinix sp.]
MEIKRILEDGRYIILNCITNKIPCWTLRKCIYEMYGMKIGRNARIGMNTVIINPKGISIGKRTIINEFCHLDGRGGLKIGNNVSVSINSMILTTTHLIDSPIFEYIEGAVVIEDNVWLGSNSLVLNNSFIKKKCIIGAGAVFKGISEPDSVYIGNPVKLLKKRNLKTSYQIDYKPYFR